MAWAERRGQGPRPWRVKYMGGRLSRSGFETEQDALDWGRLQEAEARAKRWNDPRKGDITVAQWISEWTKGQDLAETTVDNYTYMIRGHILPHFGDRALSDLEPLEIAAWERGIRERGYAVSVASKARSVFSTILQDAVTDRRIAANPAFKRRQRGRQDIYIGKDEEESLWCSSFEALVIAERVGLLSGRPDEFVMVLLAAYTGMRFGEVRGLERKYAKLGSIRVQWQLREVGGRFIKAPPKHNGRRTLPLPPFLTALISDQLKRVNKALCDCGPNHQGDYVFRPAAGFHWGRSNFANRLFRPATDGCLVAKGPRMRHRIMLDAEGRQVVRRGRQSMEALEERAALTWMPIVEGLTPHDLKHSHKVWMDEDLIPDVAQAERLAHSIASIKGRATHISDRYSHVSEPMRRQLVAALQERWETSLRRRAKTGPSALPILHDLLEPYLHPWEASSQNPPIGGAKIIEMRNDQAV
ncbi:tyrosine-type recombinase/integrase [Nonomuraea sp. NPDC004297]